MDRDLLNEEQYYFANNLRGDDRVVEAASERIGSICTEDVAFEQVIRIIAEKSRFISCAVYDCLGIKEHDDTVWQSGRVEPTEILRPFGSQEHLIESHPKANPGMYGMNSEQSAKAGTRL